jgi:hypothetical protein
MEFKYKNVIFQLENVGIEPEAQDSAIRSYKLRITLSNGCTIGLAEFSVCSAGVE